MGTVSFCFFAALSLCGLILVLGIALWLYTRLTLGRCTCKNLLQGKTVLITGGNSGIGLETAKDLAKRRARVIIACRNVEKGREAVSAIKQVSGNSEVILMELDLASTKSIRKFAEEFLKTEKRLDILINNAGRDGPRARKLTEDGFELTIGTNHLGPFLLTHLLLDLLKRSAPSRIVNVASEAHKFARYSPDDFLLEKKYSARSSYGNSKLLNVYHSMELADRLRGTGVACNSLHPGLVMTNFFKPTKDTLLIYNFFVHYLIPLFAKSSEEGAQTTIHVAVAEELEGVTGRYFSDCKEVQPSRSALDKEAARRAWEISEKLLGLR